MHMPLHWHRLAPPVTRSRRAPRAAPSGGFSPRLCELPYLGCPPPLTVVDVVVDPVSLLLLHDDVWVCVVVVVHGVPCALLFGDVDVVVVEHVFVLSALAGPTIPRAAEPASARAATSAAVVRRMSIP